MVDEGLSVTVWVAFPFPGLPFPPPGSFPFPFPVVSSCGGPLDAPSPELCGVAVGRLDWVTGCSVGVLAEIEEVGASVKVPDVGGV